MGYSSSEVARSASLLPSGVFLVPSGRVTRSKFGCVPCGAFSCSPLGVVSKDLTGFAVAFFFFAIERVYRPGLGFAKWAGA